MTRHERPEGTPPQEKLNRAEISKSLWEFFEQKFPNIKGDKLIAIMKESLGIFERRGHLDPIDQKKK